MTNKRFTLDMMRNPSQILKDGKVMSKYNIVKLLNSLYDENEQLRKELAHWKHQAEKLEKFAEWSDVV